MTLTIEQIKAVLDAAADVARDQNQGHWLVLKAIGSAHEEAVKPENLERVQHALKMSQSTHAIIHNPTVVQWFKTVILGR